MLTHPFVDTKHLKQPDLRQTHILCQVSLRIFHLGQLDPTCPARPNTVLLEVLKLSKERGSILVFDAAYTPFIQSEGVPKSIFEVEGARDIAIEVNSFSKYAGFTAVVWDGLWFPTHSHSLTEPPCATTLTVFMTTAFNGALNIVQAGGMACLDDEGLAGINTLIDYYLENAGILKETMGSLGYTVHGGTDAPYIFVEFARIHGRKLGHIPDNFGKDPSGDHSRS